MRLKQISINLLSELFGWVVWRIFGLVLIGIFGLIALYHASAAGTVALEAHVGPLYAHLIICGIFAAVALAILVVVMSMGAKRLPERQSAVLAEPHNAQLAMLVEAAMIGFNTARKRR